MGNECQWHESDPDMGTWGTSCGEMFYFSADGPKENGFNFCPYCGKKLTIIPNPNAECDIDG